MRISATAGNWPVEPVASPGIPGPIPGGPTRHPGGPTRKLNTFAGLNRSWGVNFSAEGVIDPATLERQIRRHQAEVWQFLRILGCDGEAARDLTQETFLVALRKGITFESPPGARRYLRQTARYLFLDHCRRNGGTRWDQDSQAWAGVVEAGWDEAGTSEHWLEALGRCREKLEGRRSRAVSLFYGERLSRAEVASRLDMKENGVKTMLQRIRADLRACMDRELRGNENARDES